MLPVLLLPLCGEIARAEGRYQETRDGRTLVWNSDPNPGDVVTWSGDRDKNEYAHGFGRLVWYTNEPGFDKPQLYARYWGRMVNGKLEGPVNVHSQRKTHYAIFIDGARVTGWAAGTAPSRATARWTMLVTQRSRTNEREPASAEHGEREAEAEPEVPAAGPAADLSHITSRMSQEDESIRDLYSERWPKIDIDESLRILAFPPRSLR